MSWQPISTAPKDGTEILLYVGGRTNHVCVGCWAFPNKCRNIDPADEEYPWLIFDSSTGGLNAYAEEKPTHWMPLPPPPKEQA